jgi:hypothetical protein
MIGFKITGIKQAQSFLKSSNRKVNTGVTEALDKTSMFMEGQVKKSVQGKASEPKSVDTGRFLNSVKGEVKGKSVVVSSNVKYAPTLEYGIVGTKRKERRHFRNSLDRNKGKIIKIFGDKIKFKVK